MQIGLAPEQSTAVMARDTESVAGARRLAEALSLPFLGMVVDPRGYSAGHWLVSVGLAGITMQQGGPRAPGPVGVDFVGGKMGFRRQRQEPTPPIIKAVGARSGIHPQVWDLTAGLGQDAFILAKHGCDVTLVERNPLIHCLLADGLARARRVAEEGGEQLGDILARMTLLAADSLELLSTLADDHRPDVIYIDTMFPERQKSAKVNKGMQLFQQLIGEDLDGDKLLSLALRRARYRVVVKRPRRAPPLAKLEPSLSFTGKSIRFDVYALKKLPAVQSS